MITSIYITQTIKLNKQATPKSTSNNLLWYFLMDSVMKLNHLSDVKPFKSSWSVKVKVLNKWISFSHQSGASLEMVLTDEKVRNLNSLSCLIIFYHNELNIFNFFMF